MILCASIVSNKSLMKEATKCLFRTSTKCWKCSQQAKKYAVMERHEAFTFDIQKVTSSPHITSNEVYYCRALWAFNCGIHNLTSNKAAKYVWDSTVGLSSPEERGSCIMDYCQKKATDEARFITAYSDACRKVEQRTLTNVRCSPASVGLIPTDVSSFSLFFTCLL